jgi:CRP-like cAMP-binding protein
MTVRFYNTTDIVFNYGEEGTTFCILLKGTVSVQIPSFLMGKKDEDEDVEGTCFTEVATLTAGTGFGELSLIHGQPRAATI